MRDRQSRLPIATVITRVTAARYHLAGSMYPTIKSFRAAVSGMCTDAESTRIEYMRVDVHLWVRRIA